MRTWLIEGMLAVIVGSQLAGAGELLKPPAIWKDYDPNKGDFKEEIVKKETQNGIFNRESYISAYVLGQEIRVYCVYRVKGGVKNAPGLLDVHGWMGMPCIHQEYVDNGWAVMSFDYCGKTGNRANYTKYPESLRHGNMDDKEGPVIHDCTRSDQKSITDPKQSSEYLWYAIERRVLSYLEQQKEVDKNRLVRQATRMAELSCGRWGLTRGSRRLSRTLASAGSNITATRECGCITIHTSNRRKLPARRSSWPASRRKRMCPISLLPRYGSTAPTTTMVDMRRT